MLRAHRARARLTPSERMASASRQEPVVESQPLTDPGKQDRVHQGVPVVAAFDAYRGVAVLGIVLFHILGVSGVLVKAG